MALLEPRRDVSTDPAQHYLVHACKLGKVRTYESSDHYVAFVLRERLARLGWVVLIFKTLPGAAGLDDQP